MKIKFDIEEWVKDTLICFASFLGFVLSVCLVLALAKYLGMQQSIGLLLIIIPMFITFLVACAVLAKSNE